ncbi:MAG: glycosyltransferase family 2 protein [Reyranella sp.]|nr:glycosyltransferase family 2 protein [Reyranella sp.]
MLASDVTAIIATCNRAHYLGAAVDSVLNQTAPPAQVIVVNDGSTDSTAAVLKRYDGRIELIEQENGGKSHALNQAMSLVRGAYVWIFDDDDIALPQNVERHQAVLETHPLVGFVYSGSSGIRSHPGGRVEHTGRRPMPDVADDEIFPRMLEQNFMQQQAMLVRTRCYREVGPFDVRLDRSQDYEMNLRLARRFPGKGLNAESFLYRDHDGWRGRPDAQIAADQRSRRWIDFSRELLPRLRVELELAEYLPRSLGAQPLDEPRRRRALLQRACLMARCALWEQALADFREALVNTMRGVSLNVAEQDLCRRSLGIFIRRDLAIEGLLDDPTVARRFGRLLEDSGNDDARSVFAAELSGYARTKLRHGKKFLRSARALSLAQQIAGIGSWLADAGRPISAR